jgi:hypothetical protein
MSGAELIAAERARQVSVEGYTASHDAQHSEDSALTTAAACYALPVTHRPMRVRRDPSEPGFVPFYWPWDDEYWKPTPKDRVRELVKAGALIAAEIDRLQTGGRMTTEPSTEPSADVLAAFRKRADNGGRHLHHRDCIHNLRPEQQINLRGKTVDWWLKMVGPLPVQITSGDWVTEPPHWSSS